MKTRKIINTVLIIALLIVAIVMVSILLNNANSPETVDYTELQQMIKSNGITNVYVEGSYTVYARKVGSKIEESQFPSKADYVAKISSRANFTEWFDSLPDTVIVDGVETPLNKPTVSYNDPSKSAMWSNVLITLGGFVLIIIMFVILMRMSNGANNKAMSFGKTKARLNTDIKVRFSDVAGADEEKEELQEIVEFLKNPQKFKALGARVPKGVLLVGPPGTGKTLFAKAVAGEANVAFFSISGSDFVEMFVGIGASRVRDLFDQAKHNMPCIIFIDEIDAVGRQRGAGLGGGNDEREQTLNQLLVQMDGFETSDEIIIMAATNRADVLDPALLRPGRFDRQIYVSPPDVKGRELILKVHSRNKILAPDVNFKTVARMTSGFTGADIENLLNEAAILAARNGRTQILMADVLEGINKVIAGPKKKSRVVTENDKRITAYHEAGHAIIAKTLEGCDEVQEVSIVPRGMAAGYTLTRPENDDNHVTKQKLLDNITMMLGGRGAEAIVIKDISSGASNDIQRATQIARNMVAEWGMSDEIGNIYLGGSQEVFLGRDYQQHSYSSEEMAGKVDAEIKKIMDGCYKKALDILNKNRSILENMVKVLFEKDTIYTDEVDMLFNGADAKEVIDAINARSKAEMPAVITVKKDEAKTSTAKAEPDKKEIKSENSDNANSDTANKDALSKEKEVKKDDLKKTQKPEEENKGKKPSVKETEKTDKKESVKNSESQKQTSDTEKKEGSDNK